MAVFNKVLSPRQPKDAVYDEVVQAGDGWLREVKAGQFFRIVDLGGNQAADTTFFNAADPEDHYDAVQTIINQKNIYLSTGTVLYAQSGVPLTEIVADTCGRHDTLGGACSAQSNTVRYSRDIRYMHNCRDTFLLQIARNNLDFEFEKGDLAPNINFFMNVPVTPEGYLTFDDGVSAPGYYVEMRALTDVIVLISNCPQLNNPCNAYNPTPVQLLIWDH
jgi:urea carboxylase-associated protein 1